MHSSTAMTSIRSASRPHTAMTEVPQGQMIALFTCNRCHRVLQGTCFRTACDCIFCEDCTWKHFETNNRCPQCNRKLGEQDFLELVVNAQPSNMKQNSAQSLLTAPKGMQSGELNGNTFSSACISMVEQCNTLKGSVNFLLRQMVISLNESAGSNQKSQVYTAALKRDLDTAQSNLASMSNQWETERSNLTAQLQAARREVKDMQQVTAQRQQQQRPSSSDSFVTPQGHSGGQSHRHLQSPIQRFSSNSSSQRNPYATTSSPYRSSANRGVPISSSSFRTTNSAHSYRPSSSGSIRQMSPSADSQFRSGIRSRPHSRGGGPSPNLAFLPGAAGAGGGHDQQRW